MFKTTLKYVVNLRLSYIYSALGDRENEDKYSGLGVMLELHEINGSTCLVNSKANKQDGHCCPFHINTLIFYSV